MRSLSRSLPSPSRSLTSCTSPRSNRSSRMFMAGSLGVLARAGLTDDADADLARVGGLGLDALGQIARQQHRPLVGELAVLDDDAHLAPHLQRERLVDALVAARDLLEVAEALHVGLERLAPRARPLAREPVGRVDDVIEHA